MLCKGFILEVAATVAVATGTRVCEVGEVAIVVKAY